MVGSIIDKQVMLSRIYAQVKGYRDSFKQKWIYCLELDRYDYLATHLLIILDTSNTTEFYGKLLVPSLLP